jgi:hypothetical protein
LPIETFRKVEGPDLLKALGEVRFKITRTHIPLGTPEYHVGQAIIDRIDDMAELLTGDRTHFHLKSHSVSH